MSYLPAVCHPSSARLPVLRASIGFFSALQDIAQSVWAQGWSDAQRLRETGSVLKTRTSRGAWHTCLAMVYTLGGRTQSQWELIQITWVSACFSDHGVVMVINEEDFLELGPCLLPFLKT